MQKDRIEKLGNSVIQHGKLNDRIYLMKLDKRDVPDIIRELNGIAGENGYTKIFAKVQKEQERPFLQDGYTEEAMIPGFYNGEEDCAFLGKFLSPDRGKNENLEQIKDVLRIAESKAGAAVHQESDGLFEVRKAGPADVVDISRVYRQVFSSYPFPIYDPQYLLETMKSHISYFVACSGESLVAVSSAEKDID